MEIGLWIIQVSLLVIYGAYGIYKLFFLSRVRHSMHWSKDWSDAAIRSIGLLEILGGLAMVLPMWTGIYAWLTLPAALGLSLIQALAIFMVHVPLKEYKIIPLNLYFMGMSLFVLSGRWSLLFE